MDPDDAGTKLEVQLLLEAIYARHGYDFRQYTADSITRRVLAAAAKLGARHLGELQHRVIHEPAAFSAVLDVLTVRVTEMFRDPSFYRAVRALLIPLLRTYPELKIWHAGCASGEEAYATAILLSEAGLYERAQIYATDVSTAAVEHARQGVYPEALLPSFAKNYYDSGGTADFNAYWSHGYGRISLREPLRANTHFFQHDLVSDYSPGEMHVVFCRNVLIYFGEPLRTAVFGLLEDALSRRGFLCLGSSEALPVARRAAYEELSPTERVFRRRIQA
jgi:chemotaxis protein methyltransferase CheR